MIHLACLTLTRAAWQLAQLLDVGTVPHPPAIHRMYRAFEENIQIAGACGEIAVRSALRMQSSNSQLPTPNSPLLLPTKRIHNVGCGVMSTGAATCHLQQHHQRSGV